jgi:hypothetical protein
MPDAGCQMQGGLVGVVPRPDGAQVKIVDRDHRTIGRLISGRTPLRRHLLAVASLLGFAVAGVGVSGPQAQPVANQAAEYSADVSKTILELQQFRRTTAIPFRSRDGREGIATLINLNPAANVWYVLKLEWKDGTPGATYHLENTSPGARTLSLDENHPSGLSILEGTNRQACDLFGATLDRARSSQLIYAPLCDSRIYLRNAAAGHRTTIEAATDFLRNQVWGGEEVIVLFHHLMGDLNRDTGGIRPDRQAAAAGTNAGRPSDDVPLGALMDGRYSDRSLTSGNLGIELALGARTGMLPGAWYAANGVPGVYVSIIQPDLIDPAVLQSHRELVNNLDTVEASSLCYLIAFDLARFELGYALGTEHPGVAWSDHIQAQVRSPRVPGPDGIGTIAPLVSTGLVAPEHARSTVATFAGGFKRSHGAFKYGDLALRNRGSHYGFIENGVVFSKLQPGLSTIVVLDDGSVQMKTWAEGDNRLLPQIKHARQNGVPLVEIDQRSQLPIPGGLVNRWGPGNWSGSEDRELRTIRAGAAVQQHGGQRFLIYAVFSDATPSAMARVFQAYRCDYAMLLDMNALEHTYLALYRLAGSQLFVEHLIKGMSQVDELASAETVPRFLGFPDNRDFFYVMRRPAREIR